MTIPEEIIISQADYMQLFGAEKESFAAGARWASEFIESVTSNGERDALIKLAIQRYGIAANHCKPIKVSNKLTKTIEYKGHHYWYEYKLAKDCVDICLATNDPEKYCNGFYLYSMKDPGNGKAFVVIRTDNPNTEWYNG